MKAETIIKNYENIPASFAANLTNFRPTILEAIDWLCSFGYVRPQKEQGRGRYTKLVDIRKELDNALKSVSLEVTKTNDAPRGGRTGDIWIVKDGWHRLADDSDGEPRWACWISEEEDKAINRREQQIGPTVLNYIKSIA